MSVALMAARRESYLARLTREQLAALDAQAAQVNLPALGYDLSPEDARNVARWERRTPEEWSVIVAWGLREAWLERRGGLFPWPPSVVARAIELAMKEGA